MWVVKLGGSLCRDAMLPQWLELLVQLGGGRVTVVCGGGRFADEVRQAQAFWQFGAQAAHNMAVLAMVQAAYQVHALAPALQPAAHQADIRRVLQGGQTALWMPFELQRPTVQDAVQAAAAAAAAVLEPAGDGETAPFRSDMAALELARRLNAEQLVLVKPSAVDGKIAQQLQTADFPVELLHQHELARMRALLLGSAHGVAG